MSEGEFGKYRLLAELGRGGMADVYLAMVEGPAGLGFSKLVVIKRLRQNLVEDPEFVSMLVDEARIAARLNHPNVVQTLEIGQVEDQYFLAMEFLEGQPMHRIQARAAAIGGLPAPIQYRILAEVLSGLHHAHELKDYDGSPLEVVHRDVSPHNVFVTYEGQTKVVDFGIAKAAGRASETRTGVVKGKITYMAPEQAIGKSIDRRADIFSVGVLLWEAAVGRRMWKGVQDVAIMHRLVQGDIPRSPREANPDVPEEIDRMCVRALSPDPNKRHESAFELQTELERFMVEKGLHVSQREIGKLVSDLYKDKRAHLRDVIEQRLAEMQNNPSLRSFLPMDPASISSPGIHSSTPSARNPSHSRAPLRSVTPPSNPSTALVVDPPTNLTLRSGTPVSKPRQLDRSRTNKLILSGATISASLLGLLLAVTYGKSRSETQATGAQSASPIEAPAPTEAPRSPTINVKLQATPASAQLFIDDGPALANPHEARFNRDGTEHTVTVRARGYVEQKSTVVYADDIALNVVLEREATKVSGIRTPPPPASTSRPQLPQPGGRPPRPIDKGDPWDY